MVSILYSLTAFSFALVLLLILQHDKRHPTETKLEERAYWFLIKWVIFFCLQDTVWGICASDYVTSDWPLFIASTVFHLSTVATTFVWLYFILTYLGNRIRHPHLLLTLDAIVVTLQVVLLTVNVFRPVIFHVEGGRYLTDTLRPWAFFNQYVVYLVISIITGIQTFRRRGQRRERIAAVFIFTLAPVLMGVSQVLFPDGPFYSMGYFFGCFIIHIYVVAQDREVLLNLQSQRRIDVQTRLANYDELTQLLNRHAYEVDISNQPATSADVNFAYIAIDINGLKVANDNIGHKAGDELIIGTANCMRRCLATHGKLYRIGGDEFAALIYAKPQELEFLRRDLDETVQHWQGELVPSLSISVGIASKREFPDYPIAELATIADERMYEAKGAYYKQKGIDRRGQHSAYSALCASYTKILKANATTDTYSIVCMDLTEQTADKGFSPTLSQWLRDFGASGLVHPEDLLLYQTNTSIDNIRNYFSCGNRNLNIFYRRRIGNAFRQMKMEMIPAEDFTPDNLSLYLYVKDIDK